MIVDADVIVIGLGSMGSAAARTLAERGLRVIGLDRFRPPHHMGAHAGGTRIIRMAYAEGVDYVPLLRTAYATWDRLEAETGVSLVTRTGGLLIGTPDLPTVAGALLSAQTHGLAYELLDARDVAKRYPQFTLADDEVAVFEPVAGVLRPEATITALLSLATGHGADLRFGAAVTGWQPDGDAVSVKVGNEVLRAGRVVIAPGAWASALLGPLPVPFELHRRVQHFWYPEGDREAFETGRMPVWIWQDATMEAGYGLPWQDEPGGVKAAFHYNHDPIDPDEPNAEATEAEVAAMRSWLVNRLPMLATGRWVGAVTCRYTMTPDEDFVVGLHPESDRVAIAAGFSGHGFKFVPLMGEILADLVMHGGTAHPIAMFDPLRTR